MLVNTEDIEELIDKNKKGILQTESITECVSSVTQNIRSYNTKDGVNTLYKLKKLCKKKAMPEETAVMAGNIGMHYFYLNDTKKAVKYLEESIRIARSEKLYNTLVGLLSDKGLVCFYDLKYITAKKFYLQAFELLLYTDKLDRRTEHLLYYRAGILYCYRGDYANSLLLLKKSFEYAETVDDKAYAILNIGINYRRQGLYNEALREYNKALELCGENYDIEKSSIYNNIANVYMYMGEYKTALENINKAFELLVCKDMSKFFIFFLTYTEIKVLQGESKEELEKLKELIIQVKDFFVYKCFFVYGLNVVARTSRADKITLSRLAEEITNLINKIGRGNKEYKKELNNLMKDICFSLKVLSSE